MVLGRDSLLSLRFSTWGVTVGESQGSDDLRMAFEESGE
jgi:hypothetical protein